MRQLRAAVRALPAHRRVFPSCVLPRFAFAAPSAGRRALPMATAGLLPTTRGFASSAPRAAGADGKSRKVDMDDFPPERIRNLSIIAHIDHGKSTLADRLLQMTNTLSSESNPQFLDKLKVERERGITVKAQTVSIIHEHTDGKEYLINLIDTPGHVDFSYEVSRSLGACEGGLLLVDCTQGIQAQTLSVFHHALEAELTLLPVINKVDLPHASPEETSEQIAASFGLPVEKHMRISAKSGLGVDEVLRQVVDGLPPPNWDGDNKLRALVFDTFYDRFRGVVSLIRIFSGEVKKGDKIKFLQAGKKYEVLEVGIYNPEEVPVDKLKEGQVGYLICNMKNSEEAHIGDTICLLDKPIEPLPGFQPMKAMVYAGVFPMDNLDFPQLEESIERLTLNDRSVSVERESSAALGQGYRLGFLGTLHMDVFRQRLEDEYSSNVIITAPTVPYKVVYQKGKQAREEFISNPAEFPDVTDTKTRVLHVEEPMVNATILVPAEYLGPMMDLCSKYRGVQQEYKFMDNTDSAVLKYKLPLSEIVTDFFSELKSASSGFASFDYEEAGYEKSDLVKLNMLLNSKPVDALAMIVHRSVAQSVGRAWVKKLKEVLPRQLFELAIQAAVGSKVVARESLSAMRKDVTAGLYGGHYERKLKHLNKQKEGKRRLKKLAGNIDIPQTAFFDVLSQRPRSYTTSARRLTQTPSFVEHLPPSPPAELDIGPAAPLPSVGRHDLAPQVRSDMLSDILRQVSDLSDMTSEPLFANFTRLYLAAPTSTFAPSELRAIAHAMHTLDRRFKVNMAGANERFETVTNALRDVVAGDGGAAIRGLELATLVSNSRQRRHVRSGVVRRAETLFSTLFPTPPTSPAAVDEYRMCLNHMLYLCAMARSPARLNAWWAKMVKDGVQPDSWSYLPRILVYGNLSKIEPALGELAFALPKVGEASDALVLVNGTMWAAARAGRWEVVTALYACLQSSDEGEVREQLARVQAPADLAVPLVSLTPDRLTYAMLVEAGSYRGDLLCALGTMREMFAQKLTPGVDEYMAIFQGFARFGVIPSGPAGDAAPCFPLWRNNHATTGLDNPWGDGDGDGDGGDATGTFTSNYPPSAGAMWTRSALEDLFASLLALPPPLPATSTTTTTSSSSSSSSRRARTRPPLAPSPNAVYRTLMAFGRVTNADRDAVRAALEAMTRKFGPGNDEGWVGWREDKRHMRVRTILGLDKEDDQ